MPTSSVAALQLTRIVSGPTGAAARLPGAPGALESGPPPPVVTTSWGAWAPDSRLARLSAVELVDVSPKLTGPEPVTMLVTSSSSQLPVVTGPDGTAGLAA